MHSFNVLCCFLVDVLLSLPVFCHVIFRVTHQYGLHDNVLDIVIDVMSSSGGGGGGGPRDEK